MVNIFLNGCCGRMGKAIAALCENNPDYKIVAGGDIIENSTYGFPVYTSLNECTEDFDVIIDFSNAKAVPGVLEFALNRNKPFICCTTALSDDTVASILEASEKIAVFKIVEAHHNRKLDAPSGTAMMIASAIDQEIPDNIEYVYDRHSVNKARSKNEIGISSIRGGNIVGEHSAMFISDEEILTISHSAQTRDVFAKGALTAAKFMCGKEKGYFTMSDVIAQYIEK